MYKVTYISPTDSRDQKILINVPEHTTIRFREKIAEFKIPCSVVVVPTQPTKFIFRCNKLGEKKTILENIFIEIERENK